MKRGFFGLICLSVGLVALSSCAMLVHGTTENIDVSSEPPGASVVVSDGQTGTTPFSIVARREQGLVFHFSKPGYQSVDVLNESGMETGAFVSDLVLEIVTLPFNITPIFSIDEQSGAAYAHQTHDVSVRLEPIGTADAHANAQSIPAATALVATSN